MPQVPVNSVDNLPDDLIVARNQGSLVLITGAGVSVESNVPSYPKLIEEVRIVFSKHLGREIPPVSKGEPYDQYLGKLEREYKLSIREFVKKRYVEDIDIVSKERRGRYKPNGLHIEALKLFKTPKEVRIIDLNYDPCLSDAAVSQWPGEACQEWHYSNRLPIDQSFSYISGIIHLHGSAEHSMNNDLVLTDSDYSLAYFEDSKVLGQGMAGRIMKDCFTSPRLTRLFIGASYSDPLIEYFFQCIPKCQQTYAMVSDRSTEEGEQSEIERWLGRGVTPLVYNYDRTKKNPHEALLNLLIAWNEKNLTEEPLL